MNFAFLKSSRLSPDSPDSGPYSSGRRPSDPTFTVPGKKSTLMDLFSKKFPVKRDNNDVVYMNLPPQRENEETAERQFEDVSIEPVGCFESFSMYTLFL